MLRYAGGREIAAWLAKLMDLRGVRMTRGVIGRVVVGVWLGCVTVAQLPPEIMAYRHVIRLDRLATLS